MSPDEAVFRLWKNIGIEKVVLLRNMHKRRFKFRVFTSVWFKIGESLLNSNATLARGGMGATHAKSDYELNNQF